MAQGINNSQNAFGTINKVGVTENGRAIYQLTDGDGNVAGKLTIPQNQADIFEKSYQDIMDTAPKMQKFAQKMTPEKMQKRKKTANWILGLSTLTGFLVPAIAIRGKGQFWKTALSTIAGLAVGSIASFKLKTPPGAIKFAKATQNLTKIDAQPYQELGK